MLNAPLPDSPSGAVEALVQTVPLPILPPVQSSILPSINPPLTPRSVRGQTSMRALAEEVNGVLLLDKPLGISSNAALQRVRRLLGAAKAGHTGTLDPLASGLLPLCFGHATRFSAVVLDAPKGYRAHLHLGFTSTTGDREGELRAGHSYCGTHAELEAVLAEFRGERLQTPPMCSALKHQGRALYSYARAGVAVERAGRPIRIDSLECVGWEPPYLELEMQVSKGTYVRVLAEEIGAALHCGAYLRDLRRVASGPYQLVGALTLDELEALTLPERRARLLSSETLVAALPVFSLEPEQERRLCQGQVLVLDPPATASAPAATAGVLAGEADPVLRLRLYSNRGVFLGLGHWQSGQLRAARLLPTTSP